MDRARAAAGGQPAGSLWVRALLLSGGGMLGQAPCPARKAPTKPLEQQGSRSGERCGTHAPCLQVCMPGPCAWRSSGDAIM